MLANFYSSIHNINQSYLVYENNDGIVTNYPKQYISTLNSMTKSKHDCKVLDMTLIMSVKSQKAFISKRKMIIQHMHLNKKFIDYISIYKF